MKTLTKTIIAAFIFSFMSIAPVHADTTNTEIITKVTQLQGIIQLMEQNPTLQNMMAPFVVSLVADLQELLNQNNNSEEIKKPTNDTKRTNQRTPYHIKNAPKISVDGYNEIGDDTNIASVLFNFTLEANSDSDIEINGYDSFIFEIDGIKYTGMEIAALSGYSIDIEDSEGDEITSGYTINNGRDEDFEILIFVDASETDKGTGGYLIEFDSIKYFETNTLRNGVLNINKDSQRINLLA
jgi:hypothetical protein